MTFGQKVKEIRKKKNLSQQQLGQIMGIKQQTVAQYEKAIDQPKLSTVRKIAEALDVTISELVVDWSSFSPGELYEDMADNKFDYEDINPRQSVNDSRIINHFHSLNYAGQDKALEQVEMLTKIPEYQAETPDKPEEE